MNLDKDNILTIGTVVKVKNIEPYIMIIGYSIIKNNICFDYMGCIYPNGMSNTGEELIFNGNTIEEIIFNGYSDELEKQFKEKYSKMIESIKKENFFENLQTKKSELEKESN